MPQSNPSLIEPRLSGRDPFWLGAWWVEPSSGRISSGETLVRVEPKAMDVLVYLASHQGEVVSREDLERDVWRGALVGYDAVTSTVIKLRKALDDDARQPRYIATVPKRGYCLLPGVVQKAGPEGAGPKPKQMPTPSVSAPGPPWIRIAAIGSPIALVLLLAVLVLNRLDPVRGPDRLIPRRADIPTLAVLPFANLGGDREQQYFIDGVTEDVIAGLSKLSGLRVIARNSAFAFAGPEIDPREAAAQLGVRYVLQGAVRRSGEKLRVTAKLIDADSGVHLWGEQFDGGVRDLFALQDQVAEGTAVALSVKLTADEKQGLAAAPTSNQEAYDLYLRGRVVYGSLTEWDNELARSMYRRAIEKDPRLALAYAGLALTYIDEFRSGWGKDSEAAANQALRLAERAVALDENLPQAHFALGFVYLYGRAEHARAIAEARRALVLDPNYADAYALLSSAHLFAGELDETLELDREAMRLNPTSSFIYNIHLGRLHYLKGQYQDALDAFLIAAAKNYNYLPNHVWLAASYAKVGDLEEAEWSAEQVRTLAPEFSIADWMRRRPYKNPKHREMLISGLRAAGLH